MKNKKTKIVTLTTIAALVIIGIVITLVVFGNAKKKSIGVTRAKQIALHDAKIQVSEANFKKTEFSYDDGKFVYEVDFYTDHGKYEYTIDAKDGSILEKEIDGKGSNLTTEKVGQNTANENIVSDSQNTNGNGNTNTTTSNNNNQMKPDAGANSSDDKIGIEAAKKAALKDAGLAASEVTFTREKLDREDGVLVYDIEFYTSSMEYEYEINASTGAVVSRDSEKYDAGHTTNDAPDVSAYIGVERAKEIALKDSGLNAGDVRFTKEKLEHDDGIAIYEIEFVSGKKEYEYEISANDGRILDHDVD